MMMFIIVMLFWAEVEMRRYDDVYYCNAVLGRSGNAKVNGDVYFVMLFWAEVEMRRLMAMFTL